MLIEWRDEGIAQLRRKTEANDKAKTEKRERERNRHGNRTDAPPRYGEQRDGGGRHVQLGGRRDERRETD